MRRGRKRSAVESRQEQINRQLHRLRTRLAKITPSHYANVETYRRQLNRSLELISELESELSMLACPGEYDELPAAVVADELGLRLDQVKRLIRLGEVEANGRRAHPLVCRAELERLALLRPETHLALAGRSAENIFTEAISRLRSGDFTAARRDYGRIKARETCIGDYALAMEIALDLAEGRYGDAGQAVNFILGEKLRQRDAICSHLARTLRGVRFKSDEAKGEALRLLKLLGARPSEATEEGAAEAGIERKALYVAVAAQESVRDLVTAHLPPQYCDEFNRRLGNAIFTVLHAQAHARTSVRSMSYLAELERRVPHFWEPLQILEDLREE